jgi:dTDP-4-amino-4,6-dideoxygalactose transaminase
MQAISTSTNTWSLPLGQPRYGPEEIAAVTAAIESGDLATGRIVREFEKAFADEFGFRHAVAVSSGSMANLVALAAVVERDGLLPGDKVVVSGATFISAVTPVVQLGLVPVFTDVEHDGVNVDLRLVEEAAVRFEARAMLLPHTLGQALDMHALSSLCRRLGIALLEDCCESLGAAHQGVPVGRVGDAATFSFYAGHHLTTGEGGMVGCDSPVLAGLLRSLRAFGRDLQYEGNRFAYPVERRAIASEERYVHLRNGYNAKLTDLQASFGLVQLTRHVGMAAERRAAAYAIRKVVEGFEGWRVVGRPDHPDASPFAVVCRIPAGHDLARVVTVLAAHGVEARGFLGASLPDQPCFDRTPYLVHEPYRRARDLARDTVLLGCPPGVDIPLATDALTAALEEMK